MAFIRKSKSRSFDLLSSYNHYIPGWKGLLGFLLFFLLGCLFAVIVNFCFGVAEASGSLPAGFTMNYGILISYPLMFLPAMIYAKTASARNQMFETGYAIDNNNFSPIGGAWAAVLASLLILGSSFALDPLNFLLPEPSETFKQSMDAALGGPLWASFLSTCIFAPFFEEWFCRGMILRSLLRKCRPGLAVILSALFFALIHGNLWQGVTAFIIGCAMGFVYYRTGALKLTMLMHFVNNAFSLFQSYFLELDADAKFLDVLGGDVKLYVIITVAGLVVSVACLFGLGRIKPLDKSGSCREIPADELPSF